MRTKIISTALLVLTVITMLVLLACRVRIGAAAEAVALLQSNCMTCDRCLNIITATLERERGVAVVAVDVAGGIITVGYDPKIIGADTLALKVTTAGFDSKVREVLTPEQFKQVTGKEIGMIAWSAKNCGGCGSRAVGVTTTVKRSPQCR